MSVIPVLLKDLVTRITYNQNLETVLETFRTAEFAVDSWRSGGGYHSLASILAKGLTAGTDVVRSIANGGFLDLATGNWLTLLARSWFGLTRRPASYAYYSVTLTSASGTPPQPLTAGAIWVTDGTLRFNSVSSTAYPLPVTLPSGGSAIITFKAESPGGTYNLATINALITAMPGVTVTARTLSTPGLDAETDVALRNRCRLRWATLARQPVGATYEFWALTEADGVTARAQVTRAYVDIDNPEGPGTVHVYLAGPSGAVSSAVVAEVDADLQYVRGATTTLTVSSAAALEIIPTGTAWVYGATTPDAIADAEAAFAAMLVDLPIGGRLIGGTRALFRDEVESAIRSGHGKDYPVTGVVRVSLTSGDHAMTKTQVAVPAALPAAPLDGVNFTAA